VNDFAPATKGRRFGRRWLLFPIDLLGLLQEAFRRGFSPSWAMLWLLLTTVLSAAEAPLVPAHELQEPTFRNHVQSVLTKSGCNMGACHGAGAGKNGFYLSLRGYNDEADWMAITRAAGGRRIAPADPGRSLLLLKATATVPHKGGRRFEVDSPEYATLASWIAAGASGPVPTDARLVQLEVVPARSRLQPGGTQAMQVRARFSDGRVEDVTRWAKYSSANESVANVDESGEVRVVGYGEAGVTA
jgi:Bacterial Ig-like domain (group 2)